MGQRNKLGTLRRIRDSHVLYLRAPLPERARPWSVLAFCPSWSCRGDTLSLLGHPTNSCLSSEMFNARGLQALPCPSTSHNPFLYEAPPVCPFVSEPSGRWEVPACTSCLVPRARGIPGRPHGEDSAGREKEARLPRETRGWCHGPTRQLSPNPVFRGAPPGSANTTTLCSLINGTACFPISCTHNTFSVLKQVGVPRPAVRRAEPARTSPRVHDATSRRSRS